MNSKCERDVWKQILAQRFTFEVEIDNPTQTGLEFYFNVTSGTSTGIALYTSVNVHDFLTTVSSTFSDSYSGFNTFKVTRDSNGDAILYVNSVQKASSTNANIASGSLSDLIIGHLSQTAYNNNWGYEFVGQMKNLKIYDGVV